MRINYKAICEEYNAHADRYNNKTLKAELTGFEPVHKALPGRSDVSTLVELQTRVLEVSSMRLMSSPKSSYIAVYLQTTCRWGHGFGSDTYIALKIRQRGKVNVIELSQNDNEENARRLLSILDSAPVLYAPKEYKEFWKDKISTIVDKALKDEAKVNLEREFCEQFVNNLNYDIAHAIDSGKHFDKLAALFNLAGHTLLEVFTFNVKEHFTPDFVNHTKTSIEFGWHTNDTYNSLPRTLKVSKVRDIATVGLRELGIELPGYYSHDDKMQILPEQTEAARKFARTFKAKKNKVIEAVLKKVA